MSLTAQERFEELCAGYVLHAVDEDDRRVFEQMRALATQDMRHTLTQMQHAAWYLPGSAERHEPPTYLRARIMESIAASRPEEQHAGWWERLAASLTVPRLAIANAALIVLVIAGALTYSSLRTANLSLQTAIIQQEQQLTELRSELERKESLLSVLAARTLEMVLMNGLEVNPGGYGKVIWDPDRRAAILQVSNLPTIPTDKDYQLWVIRNQVPVSAGVFAIRQDGREPFFRIENLAETDRRSINAFAITLEPAGGVPQPTGPMYLLGSSL
ncbi:MAG: anti-sigma factor [candidate division Zixibacteria bacterium]|nr:anti-sigma factor [candidate division Zixibacteria bacterium]